MSAYITSGGQRRQNKGKNYVYNIDIEPLTLISLLKPSSEISISLYFVQSFLLLKG